MRIRVIVEDDAGNKLSEGTVPAVLPDGNREMLEQLKRLADELQRIQPAPVPVCPQPYVPPYPEPWWVPPVPGTVWEYRGPIPNTIFWCSHTGDCPRPGSVTVSYGGSTTHR